MKTLIFEDDFTSRLLLQTFLARYGECHIAVNGKEAVRAFAVASENGSPYDLICMDIMLPEMDGKEALKRLRSIEEERGIFSTKGAKVIMTTAATEMKDIVSSFQDLCDAYLFKPIDTGKLLEHVRTFGLLAYVT